MPSTYTQNLGLEKPATGEQAGVWGNTANNDYDFLDTAIDGNLTIQLSAPAYSITTNQGATSEGRNKVLVFTGVLTQDATISIVPTTAEKIYFVINNTTGGFNLIFQQGAGSHYVVHSHASAILYADGLGTNSSVVGITANLQVDNLQVITSLVINGSTTFNQPANFTQPTTFGQATISTAILGPSVTLSLGGDAAYDMYYRSAGGALVRLPIGSSGQALTVGAAGPQWTTVSMAIGGAIAGSAPNCVLFINASSQMTQDGNFRYIPGVGLGIGGASPSHPLSVGGAYTAEIWLDNPGPTSPHRLVCAVGGLARMTIGLDATNETGGNSGSNPVLLSYNDAATVGVYHLSCFRNTGHTTLGNYGDLGGHVNVWCPANEPAFVVRGGGGNLQVWQDASGNQVGYIDASGHAFFAAGQQYLSLTNNRLDLWGTVPGNPLGTIHIGPEPQQTTSLCGTIVMEVAQGFLDGVPPNVVRMYYRHGAFTIQFYYNGTQYYASLGLQGQQGPASWTITSIPA